MVVSFFKLEKYNWREAFFYVFRGLTEVVRVNKVKNFRIMINTTFNFMRPPNALTREYTHP